MSDVTKAEKATSLQNVCDYLADVLDEFRFLGDEYEEEYVLVDSMLHDFETQLAELTEEFNMESEAE